MATPAPHAPSEATRQPLFNLRAVLPEGILPTNLQDATEAQGLEAVARLNKAAKSVRQAETRPVIESPNTPSRDPQGTAPEPQVIPTPEPVAIPEPTPTPKVEATLEESHEDSLLKALEAPTIPEGEKPKAEPKLTSPTDLDVDPDAPLEMPKSAKDQQNALITLSKKARELQKLSRIKDDKIAELQASGNIDMAVQAQEPLKARIAELEAHTKQLESAVSSSSLERRPEFQNLIRPQIAATNYLNELAKTSPDLDSRALFGATNITDTAARKQAVRVACADLPPDEIAQAIQAVEAIHIINGQVAHVRANAAQIESNLKKQEGEKLAAQQALRRNQSVKAHEEVHQEFMADPVLKEFLSKNPDDRKKFEALLDQSKATELDPSYANDPKKLARAIQQSLAYQPTVQLYQKQMKNILGELKKARTELLKYKMPELGIAPRSNYISTANQSNTPQDTSSIVKGAFAAVRGQM